MNSRVLKIDLSKNSFAIQDRKELFNDWIGGVGVGTQLLKEELKLEADPLSEDNVIIFSIGPFTPAYPLATKTVALFKSPLTGEWGESHAGGRTATSIAHAGYGAIVIKGISKNPVYLVIEDGNVLFRDARVIWGIEDSRITGRIIAEREEGKGTRTVMAIGGAGEKLVRYASVTTETYRHFGRLGLGAIFGSKNLKAVMIRGKSSKIPENANIYRDTYNKIFKIATESEAMKKYHLIGTSANILTLNQIGGLPTRNLTSNKFENGDNISGENIGEKYLGRRIACNHCPTACIHIASLREPYENKNYFFKTLMISYDYELIYALGSMLGVGSADGILKLIHKVESYAIDAMSTGVCLAWATEALKEGLISTKDTLIDFEFGNYQKYLNGIEYLVKQPTDFYKNLAEGVRKASDVYGGKDYALAFGKNEMPGYHTGPACHIGDLIGLRHSHLDNAGYSLDQKGKEFDIEELVDELVEEEMWRQVLSSLVVCFFARNVYTPEIVCEAFKPLGVSIDKETLEDLGKKIYLEKLRLKQKMGFNINSLNIPDRIFQTESSKGKISKDYITQALDYYSKKMGKV
ncbi:MAG: aldehyde:ferredoxin oxidoreductase [Candidatus Methanofastidiosum sp.]|nr:aldehyde:ferredoxin oxidoreductase [Methanofastidiosum sp.]